MPAVNFTKVAVDAVPSSWRAGTMRFISEQQGRNAFLSSSDPFFGKPTGRDMPWFRTDAASLSDAISGATNLATALPKMSDASVARFRPGGDRPVMAVMQNAADGAYYVLTHAEYMVLEPTTSWFGMRKNPVVNTVTITPGHEDLKAVVHLGKVFDFSTSRTAATQVTEVQ